ncbi:MAG TPA: bifunctional precorrin-2 dehydrogenase/sirohydrochlorin ferrochelatase [Ktedonobacteraceae bacterium]|nr:bifunctional precorrin-2 dehydrogenase/sirohydrochlorin ferrochelatase [Ktedonobacteraceae bacterium]
MPNYYPVMLDVRGRLAIVIGGDRVAAEKAAGLSASGAEVRVIAPQFCEELLKQAEHKRVTLRYKAYEPGDLAGALVVVAATNDPQLIQDIWNETQERGQLVNIVDVPAYCSFILPSILRREPLTIAVSTEGTNPSLAKRIRHDLEEIFPPAYGTYLQLAALARAYLRQHGVSYEQRDEFFNDYHTSEVLKELVEGDVAQATAITSSLLQQYGIEVPAKTLAAGLEEERAYA